MVKGHFDVGQQAVSRSIIIVGDAQLKSGLRAMLQKVLRTILVLNLVATLLAIVWAAIWLIYGGVALVDTNLEAFLSSPAQCESISSAAMSLLRSAVWPLMLTNGLWIAIIILRSLWSGDPARTETRAGH